MLTIAASIHRPNAILPGTRILLGFLGFAALMALVPVLDAVIVETVDHHDDSAGAAGAVGDSLLSEGAAGAVAPAGFLTITLAAVTLLGLLDGLCQSAIFGDAASLSPRFAHAVVGGTASSGFIMSVIRIVTKAALGASAGSWRVSTRLYFVVGALMALSCAVVFKHVMPTLSTIRFFKGRVLTSISDLLEPSSFDDEPRRARDSAGYDEGEEQQQLLSPAAAAPPTAPPTNSSSIQLTAATSNVSSLFNGSSKGYQSLQPQSAAGGSSPAVASGKTPGHSDGLLALLGRCCGAGGSSSSGGGEAPSSWERAASLLATNNRWRLAATVYTVYAVTLSIFPGFLAEDVHSETMGDWYNIILIAVFNFCDLLGKVVPQSQKLLRMPQALWLMALSRVAFVPLFWLAARLQAWTVVMGVMTALLGLSNGYLTAAAMTAAPFGLQHDAAELLESVMVLCLVAGLTTGAMLGWLWLVH